MGTRAQIYELTMLARATSGVLRMRTCAPAARAFWAGVEMGPADPILGLNDAFKADTNPKKVSLGVGAYRDNDGKPVVLDCVKEAERRLVAAGADHEYLPITGLNGFVNSATKLAFGDDCAPLNEGRMAVTQCLSGTGGLRVAADFFKRYLPEGTEIHIPTPTWANHKNCFADAGMVWKGYTYYDANTKGLNYDGMVADLKAAPDGSVVLLHSCAHNPTGVDPTPDQWEGISDVVTSKGHLPFFDSAYQGFASGDPVRDAIPMRSFIAKGHQIVLAQSFAKNFGLYGERTGCLSMVCADAEEKARVESQLKLVIRPMYSNPPVFGARIVDIVLSDPELNTLWHKEVKMMADRIIDMRAALVAELKALGNTNDWSHITDQIGMFAYTGLETAKVDAIAASHSVYMTKDGRISIAGLNTNNVAYVAEAIHQATS